MKILNRSLAVFWRNGSRQQFHADMFYFAPDETPRDIVERFRRLFPGDIVCSVRDGSGRFLPFK